MYTSAMKEHKHSEGSDIEGRCSLTFEETEDKGAYLRKALEVPRSGKQVRLSGKHCVTGTVGSRYPKSIAPPNKEALT